MNLINGRGLSVEIKTGADISKAHHSYAHPDSAWVTEGNGADYFNPPASLSTPLPSPILTFTLRETAEISGFVYWGYIFNPGASAIGHEPSKMRFRFFDREDQLIGEPIDREVSAPTRQRARVLRLPSTPGVKRIEVEILDNFAHLSGGDRVGLGEVRFLSGLKEGAND